MSAIVRPRPLAPGDTVALIAPAGPLASADDLDRALARVESLGLRARPGANVLARDGYLAGTDAQRLADLNGALRDPSVRGVFALRGGYGTMRILDGIDFTALRNDPKVVLGYSDLTAVLNACVTRAGVATYHGPMLALAPFGDAEVRWLRDAVMSDTPITLTASEPHAAVPGIARGRVMGGNLSLLAALAGTPDAVDCDGVILILEDVEEAPYRIDRMLTQLRATGALQRCAGIVLGTFAGCDEETDDPQRRLVRVFADRLGDLGVPVLAGVPVGHEGEQWTVPLGIEATLDAERGSLTYD